MAGRERRWLAGSRRGLVLTLLAMMLASLTGCEKMLVIPDVSVPWNEALAEVFGVTVDQISLEEKHARLMAHVREGWHHPAQNPYFLIGVLGCALWTVAYGFFIHRGIRDRAHSLPMLAICLNFTWEAMAVAVLPNPVLAWTILEWSWLLIDIGLLAILWKYGAANMTIPELQRHFHPILVALVVACLVLQLSFVLMFGDMLGFIVAFVINLVMSVLFVFMYFERRDDLRGLSYPGAWLKMLGTACTSVQCAVLLPILRPDIPSWHFMYALYVGIFLFDALYVGLLWSARRARSPAAR